MTCLLTLVDGSAYTPSVCDHAAWAAGGSPPRALSSPVASAAMTPSAPTTWRSSPGVADRSTAPKCKTTIWSNITAG